MSSGWYNRGRARIVAGTTVPGTSTIKIALVKSTYTYNPDHNVMTEITECDFTNYVRKTLSNVTVTEDDTNDLAKIDADDPSAWTSAGGATNNTIGGAVIYDEGGGTDATRHLLWFIDFTDTATNGGDISVAFHASGIAAVT